mmetsp:Transcript_45238/g.96240  ORF Transcript_45238/g.96240 Transcript_45238/m.96240 type:complete len:104 (-) Transcript_45238:110-421(-)
MSAYLSSRVIHCDAPDHNSTNIFLFCRDANAPSSVRSATASAIFGGRRGRRRQRGEIENKDEEVTATSLFSESDVDTSHRIGFVSHRQVAVGFASFCLQGNVI